MNACQKQQIARQGHVSVKLMNGNCAECNSGPCKYIGNNDDCTYTVSVLPATAMFVDGGAQPTTPVRVVVCAANKYGKTVFAGVRHFCSTMQQNMKDYDIPFMRQEFGEVQGFIDQWGVFMDRTEALAVAKAAGQLNIRRPKTYPLDKLFSEDLY